MFALLMAAAIATQPHVVNLECGFNNTPETKFQMALDFSRDQMSSNGTAWPVTVTPTAIQWQPTYAGDTLSKYKIDRQTLEFTSQSADEVTVGKCKLIEAPKTAF